MEAGAIDQGAIVIIVEWGIANAAVQACAQLSVGTITASAKGNLKFEQVVVVLRIRKQATSGIWTVAASGGQVENQSSGERCEICD